MCVCVRVWYNHVCLYARTFSASVYVCVWHTKVTDSCITLAHRPHNSDNCAVAMRQNKTATLSKLSMQCKPSQIHTPHTLWLKHIHHTNLVPNAKKLPHTKLLCTHTNTEQAIWYTTITPTMSNKKIETRVRLFCMMCYICERGKFSSIFILFQRDAVVAAGFNIIHVKSDWFRMKKRFDFCSLPNLN